MDDLELLWEYGRSGDSHAFARVAERYVDLVYSAALRQVRDPHLAQDVTQAVLIILMNKAWRLPAGTVVAAWLLKVTRYTALDALKLQGRRRHHERRAAQMRSETFHPQGGEATQALKWDDVAPLVDEALMKLRAADRDVVVLRYLLGKSTQEIAWVLGIAEDAARQRVSRAMAKLRAIVARRGVSGARTADESSFGAMMVAHAVGRAPAEVIELAKTIAAPASGALSTPPAVLARGALRRMGPSPAKWWGVAAAIAAVAIVMILLERSPAVRQFVHRITAPAPAPPVLRTPPPIVRTPRTPPPPLLPGQKIWTVPRLNQAASYNDLAAVKKYIAAGDAVDRVSQDGNDATPLVSAAFNGRDRAYDMIVYLLDRGANVNARHANGYTALMLAVRHRSPKTVELLLKRGADVTITNHSGENALDWAEQEKDAKILALIRAAAAKQGLPVPATVPASPAAPAAPPSR
jgi:RNA polymerase sigma factor (sigma-70 family)